MSSKLNRVRVAIEILVCFVPVTLLYVVFFNGYQGEIMVSPQYRIFCWTLLSTGLFGLITGWELGGGFIFRGYWPSKLKRRVWAGLISGGIAELMLTITSFKAAGSPIDFQNPFVLIALFCWLPVLAGGDWMYMRRRQSAVG